MDIATAKTVFAVVLSSAIHRPPGSAAVIYLYNKDPPALIQRTEDQRAGMPPSIAAAELEQRAFSFHVFDTKLHLIHAQLRASFSPWLSVASVNDASASPPSAPRRQNKKYAPHLYMS